MNGNLGAGYNEITGGLIVDHMDLGACAWGEEVADRLRALVAVGGADNNIQVSQRLVSGREFNIVRASRQHQRLVHIRLRHLHHKQFNWQVAKPYTLHSQNAVRSRSPEEVERRERPLGWSGVGRGPVGPRLLEWESSRSRERCSDSIRRRDRNCPARRTGCCDAHRSSGSFSDAGSGS